MTAAELLPARDTGALPALDCKACGACCTTGAADVGSDKLAYLPISKSEYRALPADVTLQGQTPMGKIRSLRFIGTRCAALEGVVGLSCSCRVYENRPRICRVFPPGSPNCLAARAEVGIR